MFLYLILFLIDVKLKKCVTEWFLEIPFQLYTALILCDKAADDSLITLKHNPNLSVIIKRLKNFLLLWMQMKMYSTLIKILVMLHFFLLKWVFLIWILIILILIIILIKMTLILLFISNFWLGILNFNLREIIPVALHPKRWWKFCVSKDEKKEIEPILTERFTFGMEICVWILFLILFYQNISK